MNVDPVASMRLWAVDMDLAGRTFEIPALPAADWLPLLMDGELVGILDLIDNSIEVDEMIVSGEITPEEIFTAINAVIEQVSGRPAHVAIKLAQVAKIQWPVIGGHLVRGGLRWDQVSIAAALDAIYALVVDRMKPESAEKFEVFLNSEIPAAGSNNRRGRRSNRTRALQDFQEMAGPPPTARAKPVKANVGQSVNGHPRIRQQPRPPRRGAR